MSSTKKCSRCHRPITYLTTSPTCWQCAMTCAHCGFSAPQGVGLTVVETPQPRVGCVDRGACEERQRAGAA